MPPSTAKAEDREDVPDGAAGKTEDLEDVPAPPAPKPEDADNAAAVQKVLRAIAEKAKPPVANLSTRAAILEALLGSGPPAAEPLGQILAEAMKAAQKGRSGRMEAEGLWRSGLDRLS